MELTFEQRMQKLSGTSKGMPALIAMVERGDFVEPERSKVVAWIKKETARRRKHFLHNTAEGAAIRQADAAVRSLWISALALIVSAIALWRTFS